MFFRVSLLRELSDGSKDDEVGNRKGESRQVNLVEMM